MSEVKENITLSHVARQEIDKWLAKYPEDKAQSAVIPALHIAQKHHRGSLTNEIIEAVADYLDIPRIAAFEVATFYSMYELKPVGRHKVGLCKSISCMLMGADELGEHLEKKLGIQFGQTTPDGKVTLKEVECLGACRHAPVVHMHNRYYESLTPEKVDELLEGLE